MNNKIKQGIVVFHDCLGVTLAWLAAYWLRFNLAHVPHSIYTIEISVLPIIISIQASAFLFFGLHRGVWRFTSLPDLSRIIKAILVGASLSALTLFLSTRLYGIPRSVFPLYGLLLLLFLGGPRLTLRWLKEAGQVLSQEKRVLIIGAGQAAEGIVRDLLRDAQHNYIPVALIDDRQHKHGQEIHGVRVVGRCKDIKNIVKDYHIDLIFIAVPSASSANMRKIVNYCEQTTVPFRTLPAISDLVSGRVTMSEMREVSITDLLGRDQVLLDWQGIENELLGKVVLVTGAGGSIGSELCRQIAKMCPDFLIILDNSEFNLYTINRELTDLFPELEFTMCLNDITDNVALDNIFARYQPDILFHAAAYKHVPLLENQIRIAVKNNIIGTCTVALTAANHGVDKFVMISTDKAVNPTNIMGASKRTAEIFCQNLNVRSSTQFITVRFGNVLASAGSVVPLFQDQIKSGGPVTVTHPEVTRYFMTIPEASQLILQATSMGRGGEIFVLDMGEPIKISYLAEQMIRLSGKKIDDDIEIQYTGLRPGEKLFEELFHESEALESTEHEKILMAQHRTMDWEQLNNIIDEMKSACEQCNETLLLKYLMQLVPEYEIDTLLDEINLPLSSRVHQETESIH